MTVQKISLKKYFDYKKKPKDFQKPSEVVMEIFEKVAAKYSYKEFKKDAE